MIKRRNIGKSLHTDSKVDRVSRGLPSVHVQAICPLCRTDEPVRRGAPPVRRMAQNREYGRGFISTQDRRGLAGRTVGSQVCNLRRDPPVYYDREGQADDGPGFPGVHCSCPMNAFDP